MQVVAVFVVCALAFCNAIVAPYHTLDLGLSSSRLIQGPSSRTLISGPYGSTISSLARGGSILTEEHGGLIARNAPLVAPLAYTAPIVSPTYPLFPETRTFAHTAYAAHHAGYTTGFLGRTGLDTVVAGPSGTIATSRALETPALWANNVVPSTYAGYHNELYL